MLRLPPPILHVALAALPAKALATEVQAHITVPAATVTPSPEKPVP